MATMSIDSERFKKMFPHLVEELEEGAVRVPVRSVRSDVKAGEGAAATRGDALSDYTPDAVAFIRRCDTPEQVEAIIDYLERREEISHDYAERLKEQLREKGLRSFGERKGSGYYLRKYYRPRG